ncbi:MAG TPA: glycosyltransferase family 4 protein [Bacteroidales bacterium]|nr:glycosyltransferase family 4 protein [Bacteroidales bacterium]
MKVVVVHTDFRLYWPSRLAALDKFLRQQGHELHVVELAGKGSNYSFAGNPETESSIPWQILFPQESIEKISRKRAFSAIAHTLDRIQPDVVMAGAIAFYSGASAVAWTTQHRKPVIIFDDARLADTPRSFLTDYIKRLIYRQVDAIFCPAPSHSATFLHFGFAPDQIFFGVNAVDNNFFCSNNYQWKESDIQHSDTKDCLISISRQIPIKNLYRTINAFISYKEKNIESSLRLILIGGGPEHEILKKIASENPKAEIYFKPFLSQVELLTFFRKAKALILPSLAETWGLVVNEAMAAGLPVLVSRQCGCAETLVHEGENGWTFDPLDLQDMERVIGAIDLASEQEIERMGQCSKEIIKNWGLERFCKGAWEAITHVVNHQKQKKGYLSKLAVHFWKGRYRPT